MSLSWSKQHPDVFLSVPIVKKNITRYSQFHVDHQTSSALKAHGLPVSNYDGGVSFWGRSVEELMAVSAPHRMRVVRDAADQLACGRYSKMKNTKERSFQTR